MCLCVRADVSVCMYVHVCVCVTDVDISIMSFGVCTTDSFALASLYFKTSTFSFY